MAAAGGLRVTGNATTGAALQTIISSFVQTPQNSAVPLAHLGERQKPSIPFHAPKNTFLQAWERMTRRIRLRRLDHAKPIVTHDATIILSAPVDLVWCLLFRFIFCRTRLLVHGVLAGTHFRRILMRSLSSHWRNILHRVIVVVHVRRLGRLMRLMMLDRLMLRRNRRPVLVTVRRLPRRLSGHRDKRPPWTR